MTMFFFAPIHHFIKYYLIPPVIHFLNSPIIKHAFRNSPLRTVSGITSADDGAGDLSQAVTRIWQYEDDTQPVRPLSVTEQNIVELVRVAERFVYTTGAVLTITDAKVNRKCVAYNVAGWALVSHRANGKLDGISNEPLRYNYDNLMASSGLELDGSENVIRQDVRRHGHPDGAQRGSTTTPTGITSHGWDGGWSEPAQDVPQESCDLYILMDG